MCKMLFGFLMNLTMASWSIWNRAYLLEGQKLIILQDHNLTFNHNYIVFSLSIMTIWTRVVMCYVGPVIPSSAVSREVESTAGYTFTPVWDLLLALPGIDTKVQEISVLILIQRTRQSKCRRSQVRWSMTGRGYRTHDIRITSLAP
jgi:hypothetical protein